MVTCFFGIQHGLGGRAFTDEASSIVPFTGRWALPLQPVIVPHSATTAATINHCFICFIVIFDYFNSLIILSIFTMLQIENFFLTFNLSVKFLLFGQISKIFACKQLFAVMKNRILRIL